jgi:hypothetical protein
VTARVLQVLLRSYDVKKALCERMSKEVKELLAVPGCLAKRGNTFWRCFKSCAVRRRQEGNDSCCGTTTHALGSNQRAASMIKAT